MGLMWISRDDDGEPTLHSGAPGLADAIKAEEQANRPAASQQTERQNGGSERLDGGRTNSL